MSYREDEYFTMNMPIRMRSPADFERCFLISNVGSVNCLDHLNYQIKITENVICPHNFMRKLLEMMRLTRIVEITGSRGDTTTICVKESNYLCEQIMTVIKRTIAKTYYPNISRVDAQEIITRLSIKERDVYYIDGDEFGCLVVLHQLSPDSCQYDYHRLPYVLFQQMYEEINKSRTVVMTPAQRDTLLTEEKKPSVEFSSVFPDGQIQLVFRQKAIQTVVPEIKRLVEIENLRRRLEELMKSSSE
jgi:hypothetical protein